MRFPVTAEGGGQRLDLYLVTCVPSLSRSRLQRAIALGQVRVAGQVVLQASRILTEGDEVEVDLPQDDAAGAAGGAPLPDAAVAFTVLHADEALIVVDKPAGLLVHPGLGQADATLVNGLLARFPDLGPAFAAGAPADGDAEDAEGIQADALRPGVVHRLDRLTSGVLLVARHPDAAEALKAQFAARTVHKRYLALVRGEVRPPEGIIDAPIGRHPGHRQRMAVMTAGRPAQTRYRVLAERRGYTWLEAFPATGRTHQIRVHLAAVGHPVAGDAVYGRKDKLIGRQALHAELIELDHPVTGERVGFRAGLPGDMVAALEALEIVVDGP